MFIYVADEQTVYSGEQKPCFMSGGRCYGGSYHVIRPLESDIPTVDVAVEKFGQVTLWRSREGRL